MPSHDAMALAAQGIETFPPAFDNNPVAYGMALYGLILIAAISLAQVVRISRCIDPVRDGPDSPITIGRRLLWWLFLAFFMGMFPDVVVLMVWNEISNNTMEKLWATDRIFDGLTVFPFLMAVHILSKSEETLTWQLVRNYAQDDLGESQQLFKKHVKMVLLIGLIAAGITVGKVFGPH